MEESEMQDSRPASPPGPTGDNGTGASGPKPKRAKKQRFTTSCLPCQRRKRKCDNESPCGSCKRRGEDGQCEYAVVKFEDGTTAQFEHAKLKQRVLALERSLAELQSKVEDLAGHKEESPSYSSEQTYEASCRALPPNQQHAFSSLAILHEAPNTVECQIRPAQVSPAGPIPDIEDLSQEDNDEAEVAAILLETKTLGHEQYGIHGSNHIPLLSKTSPVTAEYSNGADAIRTTQGMSTGSATSILLTHEEVDEDTGISHILAAMPSRKDSDVLVEEFMKDVHWMYNVIHRPTFLQEVSQLWTCVAEGNTSRVDPAWLSLYFMVLCWGGTTLDPIRRQSTLAKYSKSGKRDVPEFWKRAAQDALCVADWAGRPQIRTLQAICLLLNWPTSGSLSQVSDSVSFGVWLAAGIRIAQSLNLHKLPEDDPNHLQTDPAFARGATTIKIQLCRRIWCLLLSFDWLFCSRGATNMIRPGSFTTPLPLKLNDEDLSSSDHPRARPEAELSDSDFHLVRFNMSESQLAMSSFLGAQVISYGTILDLDSRLQQAVKSLPINNVSANGRCKPIYRTILTCVLLNRVVRLHRPYLIKGLENPTSKYAYSAKMCISGARTICDGLDNDSESEMVLFWYIYGHVLGAVICIFIEHLFICLKTGLSTQISMGNDASLNSARRFFTRGLQSWSDNLQRSSRQALVVMNQFTTLDCRLPDGRNGATQPVEKHLALIFKQVAAAIDNDNAFAGTNTLFKTVQGTKIGNEMVDIPTAPGSSTGYDEFLGFDFTNLGTLSDTFQESPPTAPSGQSFDWSAFLVSDQTSVFRGPQTFQQDLASRAYGMS